MSLCAENKVNGSEIHRRLWDTTHTATHRQILPTAMYVVEYVCTSVYHIYDAAIIVGGDIREVSKFTKAETA